MKFSLLFSATLLAVATARTPLGRRLLDVEETTLTLDRSKEELDSGRLTLSLTRVDDLLNDEQEDMPLLLERITHVGLTIQLDVQDGSLRVNGEILPLLLPEGEGVAVTVVKAEAYSMPLDLPAAFYTPEHVQALADSMSAGIASVSIRLDSETVPVDAIGSLSADEQSVAVIPVEGVFYRKIGLFVTINEIEGQTLAHSSTVYAPILQLLVTAQSYDGSTTVKQISTLSVGGQPVVSSGAPGAIEDAQQSPEQLWTAARPPASGMWAALESLFGQPKYEADNVKRPAYHGAGRKGLALGSGAPRFDGEGEEPRKGRHCRFWKEFAAGFIFIFAAIGAACTQTAPGLLLLGLMLTAVSFHAVRRVVKRCRSQPDALPQYETDIPVEYRDEKLPVYEPALQTRLTIFDADQEVIVEEKAQQ